MNAKNLLLWASLAFAMPMTAQTPQEDFKRDITLSGSNYVAYRGPQKQLTPAPKGYKPFYLSHYGRHGSRFMIGKKAYDVPYFSLLKAKQEGKLTAKGEETLAKVKMIREEAKGRDGELTPLGALQHQGITRRMMERFPEIFAGNTNIEARSTTVIRCILSMENGLQQMLRMNPKLHIFHDASEHDMYYMNLGDRHLDSLKNCVGIKVVQQEFAQKHINCSRLMKELFNDPAWVKQNINQSDLNRKLYEMALYPGHGIEGQGFALRSLYRGGTVSELAECQYLVADGLRQFALYGQCAAVLAAQSADRYSPEGG